MSETNVIWEKSVLYMSDGKLWLDSSGVTFPPEGGMQNGTCGATFNLSAHLEELIRKILAEQQPPPRE